MSPECAWTEEQCQEAVAGWTEEQRKAVIDSFAALGDLQALGSQVAAAVAASIEAIRPNIEAGQQVLNNLLRWDYRHSEEISAELQRDFEAQEAERRARDAEERSLLAQAIAREMRPRVCGQIALPRIDRVISDYKAGPNKSITSLAHESGLSDKTIYRMLDEARASRKTLKALAPALGYGENVDALILAAGGQPEAAAH